MNMQVYIQGYDTACKTEYKPWKVAHSDVTSVQSTSDCHEDSDTFNTWTLILEHQA